MSVVNKINLNGDEYNITDPTAQAAADNALNEAITANNKADTAISTANTASTTATAANTAASAAQTDVDALELVVADMLKHNTSATGVDLTGYNSTTPYTAPYDGYIRSIAGYGSGNIATVTINNLQETTPCITTATISKITYVKKGTLLYATITGNASAYYFPMDT